MTRQIPPEITMVPRVTMLPAGTALWRCHRSRYPATGFKSVEAHTLFGGSRFDCTAEDPYPYLYATREPATALAEVLLRSMDFDPVVGARLVPWAQASRYTLAQVVTDTDLTFVSLRTEEDLAAVCQTSWLLDSEPDDYPRTRYWARELRRQAKEAHGLLWQSRRHRPREALVLFGDRCDGVPFHDEPLVSHDLATLAGVDAANRLLAPLRAVIVPPEPAD